MLNYVDIFKSKQFQYPLTYHDPHETPRGAESHNAVAPAWPHRWRHTAQAPARQGRQDA